MYGGIDWASREHAISVLDDATNRYRRLTVPHSAEGVASMLRWLGRLGDPATIPIAIERPDGLLVDRLLEAGHPVVPVQPNAIAAWREAHVMSGAKSDRGDADVLCDYLRVRDPDVRRLAPYSAATKALRTVVRARDDLVHARVAAGNQLAALLDLVWPGGAAVFADVTTPIALDFLTRYPTADAAAHLGPKRMASFCAKHGYSGRRSPEELIARLRAAPGGITDPHHSDAARDAVLAYVGQLRGLDRSLKQLDRSVRAHLDEHPDAAIFTSLPRAGRINAAQILAEWGDCRDAYSDADAVACLAGCGPVTKASGKHRSVTFRWACNKRFRQAIVTFADNSRHDSDWAADVYRRARARGKDHPHATRILARAWIRVIYQCWIAHEPYDPTRHTAARRLAERPDQPQQEVAA